MLTIPRFKVFLQWMFVHADCSHCTITCREPVHLNYGILFNIKWLMINEN